MFCHLIYWSHIAISIVTKYQATNHFVTSILQIFLDIQQLTLLTNTYQSNQDVLGHRGGGVTVSAYDYKLQNPSMSTS